MASLASGSHRRLASETYRVEHRNFYNRYLKRGSHHLPFDTFLRDPAVFDLVYKTILDASDTAAYKTTTVYFNALNHLGDQYGIPSSNPSRVAMSKWATEAKTTLFEENSKNAPREQDWSWDQIVEMYQEMLEKFYDRAATYKQNQQTLMLSLYVLQPPRRLDYGSSRLYLDSATNGVPRGASETDNYVYINGAGVWMFHLGSDKVAGDRHITYLDRPNDPTKPRVEKVFKGKGSADEAIPSQCRDLIKAMEERWGPRKYLLTRLSDVDQPIDDDSGRSKYNMARLLAEVPSTKGGAHSGLTLRNVRSARVTHAYENRPTLAAKQVLAKQMRTSVGTMDLHYNKIRKTA